MTTQHDLVQGSEEWSQFRLEHFGSSEASAMLGLSKHVTRSELLRMKHTGVAQEFSDWFQKNILDNGHAVEALARPMAEAIIGDELYPATYSDGKLSVSCDGLTMVGTTAWEHKQWNEALAAAVRAKQLPDEHMPQCQQVTMVTGADRVLFMVSDGTPDKCEHMWVYPDVVWRKRILQGWAQFAEDLANYRPAEVVAAPVAAPVMSLPTITYRLNGLALTSNLAEYREAAERLVEESKKPLETDQDFANQDAMNKSFKEAEKRIAVVCDQVIGEIKDVDAFTRELSHVGELIRQARLNGEKQIEARKTAIRAEIQESGNKAVREHLDALNKRIGKPYLPDKKWADFATAMRGKKTITSLRGAVNDEVARFKIEANEIADRIQVNLNSLRELAADHTFLFADTAQIILKQNDDLVALIKTRIADHKEAERVKKEKESDIAAALPGPVARAAIPTAAPVAPPAVVTTNVSTTAMERPSDHQIIEVLAAHYGVPVEIVVGWLIHMDYQALTGNKEKRGLASR